MNALRISLLLALAAGLPLLQGCSGEHPGFSRDIDLRQHLQRFSSGPWEEKPNQMQVKVGPDSLPVTIEWMTASTDVHRGIASVSVDFPSHRKGTYNVQFVDGQTNRGTRDAALLTHSLMIQWARTTPLLAKQSGAVPIELNGDGTSRILY